jgi:hypothetical protein
LPIDEFEERGANCNRRRQGRKEGGRSGKSPSFPLNGRENDGRGLALHLCYDDKEM